MEQAVGMTFTTFEPELDKPVNVTALFEERHITRAVLCITIGLNDYCSGFYHSVDSPATVYRSRHHLWISISDVPLSKKLKEALRNKFQTDNGSLLFYNWEQMNAKYPDISHLTNLHKSTPAFVGLPLPNEDSQ